MGNENPISNEIIGAAIEVHRQLGPGLLESATYLKLTQCKLGLILNFSVRLMKSGIKRVALNL